MSDDTILAEIDQRIADLEAEANRYRAAAALLRGGSAATSGVRSKPNRRQAPRSNGGPTSTMSMVQSVLAEHGPLTIRNLAEQMIVDGWDTQSDVPTNTVRTAVGRLTERGVLSRHDDGSYKLFHPEGQ